MQYKFNQYEVKASFGITFLEGTDKEIMVYGAKKDNGLDIDWINQNGTERYHGQSYFKTKRYVLPIIMKAVSEADFWQKYYALEDFFRSAGEFNFDLVHRNRRFKVSYSEMSTVDKLTNFNVNPIAVKFTIVLLDDHPTERFTIV